MISVSDTSYISLSVRLRAETCLIFSLSNAFYGSKSKFVLSWRTDLTLFWSSFDSFSWLSRMSIINLLGGKLSGVLPITLIIVFDLCRVCVSSFLKFFEIPWFFLNLTLAVCVYLSSVANNLVFLSLEIMLFGCQP